MCGICGVVQIGGGEPRPVVERETLDRMTDVMTHRGPDDRGIFMTDGVAFGVRRLSVVDVEGGHQPFSNEDAAIWAMQNGELYNHRDLRAALGAEGHRFRSRCDTEVLPHLYERFGPAFPERLRGMFGLAVWDSGRRRAVVARDRLGIKPLYYAVVGDLLVFASELKSLLASGLVEPALDYDAIDAYLTFGFFPGPGTPFAGVTKLMPGHALIADSSGVHEQRYWSYPEPRPGTASEREYIDGLMEQLEESVRLRLMADVPLGAMLSGGLDSSLIVALMARNMSEPVKTFSVGFAEDPDSELADARLVASAFGADHHELELSNRDSVDLEELSWFIDEPLADLSSLGFLALSELAARHVTVALSGQGADELLGGYRKHRAAAVARAAGRLPDALVRRAASVGLSGPPALRRMAETLRAPDPMERLLAMSSQVDRDLRARLYRGPLADTSGRAGREAVALRLGGASGDPLATTLHIDGQLALVDDMLHYFDRASMAYSLEVRVPFLDHRVVEYAATIPTELKVRRLRTKHLLKEAARGIVPDRVIDKRKIGFFRGSVAGWFDAQASSAVRDHLLDPGARYAEFLDRRGVEALLHRHTEGGRSELGQLLLSILMLEVWLASYVPRALRHSSPVELRPAA
jgi:asparagine synthase (glutamine-hydrolysing)